MKAMMITLLILIAISVSEYAFGRWQINQGYPNAIERAKQDIADAGITEKNYPDRYAEAMRAATQHIDRQTLSLEQENLGKQIRRLFARAILFIPIVGFIAHRRNKRREEAQLQEMLRNA